MRNYFKSLQLNSKTVEKTTKFTPWPKKFVSVDIHEREVKISWRFLYKRYVRTYK